MVAYPSCSILFSGFYFDPPIFNSRRLACVLIKILLSSSFVYCFFHDLLFPTVSICSKVSCSTSPEHSPLTDLEQTSWLSLLQICFWCCLRSLLAALVNFTTLLLFILTIEYNFFLLLFHIYWW